jgi:hypothetical protein
VWTARGWEVHRTSSLGVSWGRDGRFRRVWSAPSPWPGSRAPSRAFQQFRGLWRIRQWAWAEVSSGWERVEANVLGCAKRTSFRPGRRGHPRRREGRRDIGPSSRTREQVQSLPVGLGSRWLGARSCTNHKLEYKRHQGEFNIRDLSMLPCRAAGLFICERQSPVSGTAPAPACGPSPLRPPNAPRRGSSVCGVARAAPRVHTSSVSAALNGALSLSPEGVENPEPRRIPPGRSALATSANVPLRSHVISRGGGASLNPDPLRRGGSSGVGA